MRVLFINLHPYIRDIHGIYALSGCLKKAGVEVQYLPGHDFKSIAGDIARIRPDLLLYSAMSSTLDSTIEFDRWLKPRLAIPSVIGGPAATFETERLKRTTIDFICVGEGELALLDFIEKGFKPAHNIIARTHDGAIPLAKPGRLDELPFPDREPVYAREPLLRDAATKQFIAGRGCPYRCAFCWNHQLNELYKPIGPVIRRKSVDYLIEEILEVKERYPLKDVIFNDDIFTLDRKWFLEFAEKFPRRVGLTYGCNLRANHVDPEIARALKESGCRYAAWSIEAGSARVRNEVLGRNMSNEAILNAARLLNEQGIASKISNIVGIPGETYSEMLETVELNIEAAPHAAFANVFVPYPGLKLTEYARSQGFLTDEGASKIARHFWAQTSLNLSKAEKKLIHNVMCFFYFFVRFPWTYRNAWLRKQLLKLPPLVARAIYEPVFSVVMAQMTSREVSFGLRVRMGLRHLRYLFWG